MNVVSSKDGDSGSTGHGTSFDQKMNKISDRETVGMPPVNATMYRRNGSNVPIYPIMLGANTKSIQDARPNRDVINNALVHSTKLNASAKVESPKGTLIVESSENSSVGVNMTQNEKSAMIATIRSLHDQLSDMLKKNQYLREELNKLNSQNSSLEEQIKSYKPEPQKKQSRYWSNEEHKRFLKGLDMYGKKDVKSIAAYVGTRTAVQVRTHAQKYFLKLSKSNNNMKYSPDDFNSPSGEERHSTLSEEHTPNCQPANRIASPGVPLATVNPNTKNFDIPVNLNNQIQYQTSNKTDNIKIDFPTDKTSPLPPNLNTYTQRMMATQQYFNGNTYIKMERPYTPEQLAKQSEYWAYANLGQGQVPVQPPMWTQDYQPMSTTVLFQQEPTEQYQQQLPQQSHPQNGFVNPYEEDDDELRSLNLNQRQPIEIRRDFSISPHINGFSPLFLSSSPSLGIFSPLIPDTSKPTSL